MFAGQPKIDLSIEINIRFEKKSANNLVWIQMGKLVVESLEMHLNTRQDRISKRISN